MAKSYEREYQIKSNTEKNAHAEFQGWSLKRLMNEILKIRKEKGYWEAKYNNLVELTSVKPEVPRQNYNQKWTYPQKICFILLNEQRPLTSSQIYKALTKADKHILSFRNPIAILNSYLSRMLSSGRLVAYKLPGNRKNFYVLPEWFGEDNKLKSDYLSHLNFLS